MPPTDKVSRIGAHTSTPTKTVNTLPWVHAAPSGEGYWWVTGPGCAIQVIHYKPAGDSPVRMKMKVSTLAAEWRIDWKSCPVVLP